MTILIDPGVPRPQAGSGGQPTYHGMGSKPPTGANVGDLWIDTSNPAAPQVKVLLSAGNWSALSQGQAQLPAATQQGQILVSQTGTAVFAWAPETGIIEGTY